MLDVLKTQWDGKVHTVRRFLQRPIQVSNGAFVLGPVPGASGSRSHDARTASEARRRLERPMKRALFELLERHPSSRRLMRHLDVVERKLREHGLAGVQALPTPVISHALAQLENVVWDWSNVPLAELRSRMAVMIKSRPPHVAGNDLSAHAAAPDALHHADVCEVDHATYEEMQRSWTGQNPQSAA